MPSETARTPDYREPDLKPNLRHLSYEPLDHKPFISSNMTENLEQVQVVGRELEVDDQETWDAAAVISKTDHKPLTAATSNDTDFRTEHGRRYHAFEDNQ
jgi:hypothetical protein